MRHFFNQRLTPNCTRSSSGLRFVYALLILFAAALPKVAVGQMSSDGIRYVSPNGSDTNNGLSWSTAKLTLGGAQTSCPASGNCVIHVSAAGITLSANFTMNRALTTVTCELGAVIKTAVSSLDPIVIAADDTRITECAFTYSSGSTGAIQITNSVSRVELDHNVFENYPDGGTNSAIFVGDRTNTTLSSAVTDAKVTDNLFLNNSGSDINIQDYVLRVLISHNRIVTGTVDVNNPLINAQTSDSNTSIRGLIISSNIMSNGLGGDCIQIQQLSETGTSISGVTVSSNVCILQATTGTGYSMAGVTGLSFVGNTFDANGENMAGMVNAPFEFVNVKNGTESGNSATLGTQSGNLGFIYTVIGNGGSSLNDAFTGNTASIAYTGTGISGCWDVVVAAANSTVSRNTFTGNGCDLTGSTGKVAGFYLQSANALATVNSNFVTENNFIGAAVTGDAGICVEHDSGTMVHNVIGPNNVFNFHLQYCQNFGAQTSGLPVSALDALTYGSSLSGPH
jgi:hypothetical protein